MPEYFHVAPAGLNVGDIIQPGSWGRLTRQFGDGGRGIENHGDGVIIMWEASLESVRAESFPDEVSRLECVFACLDEAAARQFLNRFRQDAPHNVYVVEPLEPEIRVSIGDYAAITDAPRGPLIDTAVSVSTNYWKEENPVNPEVLIGGPVRVVRIL